MMNILVTGIHGFVGSNLVEALKENCIFYGLDIVSPAKEGVVTTFSWLDIEPTSFPFQTLPQFDAIIHLAGKAHDTKNQSAAQSYFDINTGLTQKIFDFFLESSAKKFIFFSSVKAAADSVVGDVLTEDVIPTPVGPYGESKIKAEEYIKNHFMFPTVSISEDRSLRLEKEKGRIPKNKQVYILRPCMIHGPGNKGNLNLLYNVVKKGPYGMSIFAGPKLRYLWGKQNEITFTNFDQKGIHEKLYPLNVSVVIGVGVNISRIFFDFRYEQGIGNISKSIVYDNINSDGSTGVSPIIFRRRDSALSFSFGFIL